MLPEITRVPDADVKTMDNFSQIHLTERLAHNFIMQNSVLCLMCTRCKSKSKRARCPPRFRFVSEWRFFGSDNPASNTMNISEEAFLFSTFKEFCKCWRSGTRARVIMESMNGNTFVNFSALLGHPDNVHFQPRPSKRNPTTVPRKKSE